MMQWKQRTSGDSTKRKGTLNTRSLTTTTRKKTILLILLLQLHLKSTMLLGGEGVSLELQGSLEQQRGSIE